MSQLPRISSSRFTFANLAYKYVICYSNGTHLPKEFYACMLLYTLNSQQISVVYASYCCFLMARIVMSHCHVTVGHMMKFFGILKPVMKMTSHITWEHRLMIFKAPQHVHIASPFLCSVGCDLLQFFPVHNSPRIYILLYMCRQFAFFPMLLFNSVLCLHTHKRSDDFVFGFHALWLIFFFTFRFALVIIWSLPKIDVNKPFFIHVRVYCSWKCQ